MVSMEEGGGGVEGSTCSLPPATQGKSSQRTGDVLQLPVSGSIHAVLSNVHLLSLPLAFTPALSTLHHLSPKSPFFASVPSVQGHERVTTAVWSMAANENHNYKITFCNRNDRGAIMCLTSVLVGELKSNFALLLFTAQEKN